MEQYIAYRGIWVLTILGGGVLFFLCLKKWWRFALLFGCIYMLGIWMRWVEPFWIQTEYAMIDLGIGERVALIADLHLGVYKDENYLARVVNHINELEVDRVLIAGDFLNIPLASQTLEGLFAPLEDLQMPWYAVMGNHDVGIPGEDLQEDLTLVLEDLGGIVIDNKIITLDNRTLVGLGSHLAGRVDEGLLDQINDEDPVVVLTHNPDTISLFPLGVVDLTVVGHTHCGQVRIPLLYKWYRKYLIPTEGDFDCGYSEERTTKLFITPGLGEVILPIRLANPPMISILDL